MINSNHTWLSLLDVVCRFNSSDQYIPLCTSHNRFLSAIPAVTPFLSGFEYHLLSLTKPCDSLVCMLTRDLHTFARLSSIGDDDKKEHLVQANHATEILLQLPELLCVTDHVWFELDAYPNNALSLFVGNHSNIQSMDERNSILMTCTTLSQQWISSLSSNPIPLFDFDIALSFLFSLIPDWLISEVGIMDRNSDKAHIKLLMTPPKSVLLNTFLDIFIEIFPHTSIQVEQLRSSDLFEKLNNFHCHYQLSIALFKDRMIGAFEILPEFNSQEVDQYDNLFHSILASCSTLLEIPDLNNQLACETLFLDIAGLSFSSRMHHLKLCPKMNGVWVPKIYRDLRIIE